MSQVLTRPGDVADALLRQVGKRIVLGLPIGIGKPVHVANALYERAVADPTISLTIFSGLTLEVPRGRNDVERRFLGPLAERLYAGWPALEYARAVGRNELPGNVQVHEFYLRPGAYLGNPLAQQNYASINYSQVARELLRLGVNVVAQLVAAGAERPQHYSLGSNPEVTLDLLPELETRRRAGETIAFVGQVNRNLPYMGGDAELPRERFDLVLDADDCDYPLFTLPNRRVSPADYATGMHVASLVPDGGTIQVGIGSLSDAVAHCLRLRHESPAVFAGVLDRLPGGAAAARRQALPIQTGAFDEGLFAASELLSDALFSLFTAGIVRRPADRYDNAAIHAGFFVGSSHLYERLRMLPDAERKRIHMKPISEVNTLYGDEQRKRRQRRKATFVNETMMATLLGTAVSDTLEDGRVVSGVGGQFDFVTMAQALGDASSVLMCRARRMHRGRAHSNFRWSYGQATVPRHCRDVFVSEYGIADTRGRSDRDVIDAMIAIADAGFQDELVASAVAAGKLERGYVPEPGTRGNTPEAVAAVFEEPAFKPYFPPYPLGTELTQTEQDLVEALAWLEPRSARPLAHIADLVGALLGGSPDRYPEALARMDLAQPGGFREHALSRLIARALDRTKR